MAEHPIAVAYKAHKQIPLERYRTNELKKIDNPVVAAPDLLKAMVHWGEQSLDFTEIQEKAINLAYDRRSKAVVKDARLWGKRVQQVQTWQDLETFLNTLTLFLKAGPDEGRKGKKGKMRSFTLAQKLEVLKPQQITKLALDLVKSIGPEANTNKLKQMSAHLNACHEHWDALAALARFYPRKGIPKSYVDALVEHLETTEMQSFKQVVAQSLIFYQADQITQRSE